MIIKVGIFWAPELHMIGKGIGFMYSTVVPYILGKGHFLTIYLFKQFDFQWGVREWIN